MFSIFCDTTRRIYVAMVSKSVCININTIDTNDDMEMQQNVSTIKHDMNKEDDVKNLKEAFVSSDYHDSEKILLPNMIVNSINDDDKLEEFVHADTFVQMSGVVLINASMLAEKRILCIIYDNNDFIVFCYFVINNNCGCW